METMIAELKNLAERFKTNSKLSKTDQNRTRELLFMFLGSPDTLDQGMNYLFRLPATTVADVFWQVWKESNVETQQLLVDKLTSHKEIGSKAGNTRELLISKKFLMGSDDVAIRLLSDWCLRVTKGAQKIPNKSNSALFEKEMINENLIIKLNTNGMVTPRQLSAISLMVLYTLFSGQSIVDNPERALYYFDWIKNTGIPLSFNPETGKQLAEMIKDWPQELISKASELKAFPLVKKDNGIHSIINESGYQVRPIEQPMPGEMRAAEPDGIPKGTSFEIFDAKDSLERIKQYIIKLEGDLGKLRAISNNAEKNYENEKNHRISLQNRLMETEEQLKLSSANIDRLRGEQYEAREKIKQLEEELNKTRASHKEKVDNLLDMSEHEVNFVVKEFQNVLTRDLRLEYSDYMSVVNDEITPELAENFKAQLMNIFTILRNKGLKL